MAYFQPSTIMVSREHRIVRVFNIFLTAGTVVAVGVVIMTIVVAYFGTTKALAIIPLMVLGMLLGFLGGLWFARVVVVGEFEQPEYIEEPAPAGQ